MTDQLLYKCLSPQVQTFVLYSKGCLFTFANLNLFRLLAGGEGVHLLKNCVDLYCRNKYLHLKMFGSRRTCEILQKLPTRRHDMLYSISHINIKLYANLSNINLAQTRAQDVTHSYFWSYGQYESFCMKCMMMTTATMPTTTRLLQYSNFLLWNTGELYVNSLAINAYTFWKIRIYNYVYIII